MAEEASSAQLSPMASRLVRCIVKLGRGAIMNKGELESINEGSMRSACAQLQQGMSDAGLEKVLGLVAYLGSFKLMASVFFY